VIRLGKDKSWKLENTLKIDDTQLKTPLHDKLCLYVDEYINDILNIKKRWPVDGFEKELFLSEYDRRKLCYFVWQDFPKVELLWEEPIKNNGFVIGIPDFTFTASVKLMRTIKGEDGRIVVGDKFYGIIEVKPKIQSIGETMRQLKIYKSYLNRNREHQIYLVTLEPKYKKLFEKQGIIYYIVDKTMLS